ncbi:ATP-binding protein [Winogradskyella sp.]|uniref:ATP-binding protein n=1 Tax=Winogradskyella sp. TaxID=1883156 RepID=UPI003AB224D8
MGLNTAHEGYEYQDLLTAYFILAWILEDEESSFFIDKKEFDSDRFDDLTIINNKGFFKRQIKYSNLESNHSFKKEDLSTDGSYNLAIDELFNSWNNHPDKSILDIRLCLAWNEPKDELLNILDIQNKQKSFINHDTTLYRVNVEKLWPKNKNPIKKWRRFRTKSNDIQRDEFVKFCEAFTIEIDFPKFSLSIHEPGQLEKIILDQVDRLGIGIFPNNKRSKEEFILSLSALIRKSRSKGLPITTKEIFKQFAIITDFGSIEQSFPIDERKNIPTKENVTSILKLFKSDKRIILKGEPGSGKSWFVNNLINELNSNNINTVKHYCYTDLQDKFQKERIKTDVFYGNIIYEILNLYPELKDKKPHIYASSLSELNILIENISEPTVLIIDGLDHIERVFNYRPYDDLSISEIDIINEINKINISDNVSILVASQPIKELANIHNFTQISIPNWDIDDIKALMSRHYLDDEELDDNHISGLLLEKSSGNPLYLNYLIEEIKCLPHINLNVFNSLPYYSYNLKEYYSYLLAKQNLNNDVPFALSAVNFSLTKQELKEITELGVYVDETLDLLKPVLKQNTSSKGYIIYHESFRRFILEKLKSNEVVERRIFQPVIDWFDKLDFYCYPKAYRYYFQVLNDSGYYEKVLGFISKDFIKKCVYSGHPWDIIKNNYYYFSRACIESKDVEKVIILNEINKTLTGTEDSFDEAFLYYIDAFGCKNGYEAVSEYLLFETKPTLTKRQGLQVCYLIESKGSVAPWEYYSDYFKPGESIQLDDFKYYIRVLLSQNNEEKLIEMTEKIKKRKFSDFKAIFIEELSSLSPNALVDGIVEKYGIINEIFTVDDRKEIKKEKLKLLAEEILKFENIFQKEVPRIKIFFKQIEKQINDRELITGVIDIFKSNNWFYNWLIYYIKVKQIRTSKTNDSVEIRNAFDLLVYNLEPFYGKPRTCDLYSLNDFIYESINEGLSFIKEKEDWGYVLEILNKVSTKTTTYLQNSPGGPIATNNFFKLLIENINENNSAFVIELLVGQYERNKDDQFHAFLSEYCFQLVKAYAFINDSEKIDLYFNQGVEYVLGYTWRRDLTLEDLTESIVGLSSINDSLGNEYILKLKELVDSVVQHTDGKDTKHFPVEWFEKFYKINPKNASLYLLHELLGTRCDWRLESSLKHLITNPDVQINDLTKCFLNQTMLVESDDAFLLDSIKLFDKLKLPVARNTLAASINARLSIKQNSDRSKDFQKEIKKYTNELKLSNAFVTSNTLASSRKSITINPIVKIKRECVNRKEFSDLTLSELSVYLNDNPILEKEVQSLIYVFDSYKVLTPEIKDLIQHLVRKNGDYHGEKNIDITPIFDSNTGLSVFFWMARFIYQRDGWFKNLSNIGAFQTAYKLNPNKSIDFLFELLASNLNLGYKRVFSANLFNALSSVGYNPSLLEKAWLSMYEIIEYRLPSRETYDWDKVLSNELDMDINEIHICLLFCRFKSYTVQKYHIGLSSISILLFEDSQVLIKPIKWFLLNHEYFKKSIILAILQLLVLFEETTQGYLKNFESELKSIYPTYYFLIDILIMNSFHFKTKYVVKAKDDLIYPISEEEYKWFEGLNTRHDTLMRAGIDTKNIFGKFKATFQRKYSEYLEIYGNRMCERTVSNIYFSDYLLELLNNEYYEKLNSYTNSQDVFESIKIDIKSIVAQYLSLDVRPDSLKRASNYDNYAAFNEELFIDENGWVRIAHFEHELIKKEHYKLIDRKIYGGVVFKKGESMDFPYSAYRLEMDLFWNENYVDFPTEKTPIFSFIQNQFQFEYFKILWLNPSIMKVLELRYGDFRDGMIAYNSNDEVVLRLKTWQTEYVALGTFSNIHDEIPKLDGSELVMREDYFKKLCDIYYEKPKYCIFKSF